MKRCEGTLFFGGLIWLVFERERQSGTQCRFPCIITGTEIGQMSVLATLMHPNYMYALVVILNTTFIFISPLYKLCFSLLLTVDLLLFSGGGDSWDGRHRQHKQEHF